MSEQTRFWKATGPDGMDFYTGSIDYAAALHSGEPLPELSGGEFPGGGWYHVGVHPTSCVGMRWPCRLFVVEPVGQVEHEGQEKAGVRSLRVVEERPAYEALGPQGEHVAALISRVKRLTPEEVRRLNAARDAAGYAAGYAARDAVWYAALGAVWYAALGAARDAAWYAACALLVRDLISAEHYRILTGPWASVIGPVHPLDSLDN